MTTRFNSPTDVEDAYYDAIDECDLEKMMSVWDPSPQAACLLPMQPMHHGREAIRALWRPMLDPELKVDITVNHLEWIEQGEIAIHLLEELVTLKGTGQRQPPIYATNVFRRDADGWHLLLHVNSPAPPPANPAAGAPGP
ncbi:MAG TPA: ketosteroid isomerase [Sedimenticola thiotaurini]|uniref:Ketosteroid isomerase n=1 Tax=Sedimenticola thiotaurini TaxID=1543721 RepID=A0A831RNT4_9GAMM|nr:ketosteroid isomerase [Sedimenticola thiotaurini]